MFLYGLITKGFPWIYYLWKKDQNIEQTIENKKLLDNYAKKEEKDKIDTRNKIDLLYGKVELEMATKKDLVPITDQLKKINGSVSEHHADKSIHFEKDMFVKITDCHKLHSEAIDKFDTKVEKIYEKIDSFYGILNKTKDTN